MPDLPTRPFLWAARPPAHEGTGAPSQLPDVTPAANRAASDDGAPDRDRSGAIARNEAVGSTAFRGVKFRQAQSVLVGLCGCTDERAAQALRDVAQSLGIDEYRIAAWLLASKAAGHSTAEGWAADRVVDSLVAAAVLPAAGGELRSDGPVLPCAPDRTSEDGRGAGDGLCTVEFKIVLIPAAGRRGLSVHGELDVESGRWLSDAVQELCRASMEANELLVVVLDLTAVTFLDSSGALALDDVYKAVTATAGHLHVIPPATSGPRWVLRHAAEAGWLSARVAWTDN